MLQGILEFEKSTFISINRSLSSTILDPIMLVLSSELFWLVLGIISSLFLLCSKHRSSKKYLSLILFAVTFSDLFCYRVLKPFFKRERPCHELKNVRLLDGCGSQYGLPSNHAANSMAIVITIYLICKKKWALRLLPLVFLVGYSRIYLGVHYPGDILFGFAIGGIIGYLNFIMLGSINFKLPKLKSS